MTASGPTTRTAAGRTLRDAWRGVRRGWTGAPGAGAALIARLAAGTAVAAALSGGSAWWLSRHAVDGRLRLDEALESAMRDVLDVHQATWLAGLNSSAMLMPLVVLVILWAGMTGRWARSITYGLLYGACKIVTTTGWQVWERNRPGDVLDGALVPEGLASNPSGHVVQGVALWGLLVWWWVRASNSLVEKGVVWVVYLSLMAAVAVARVEIGAHHPTDVLAAAALGAVLLATAAWAEGSAGYPHDSDVVERIGRNASGGAGGEVTDGRRVE